MRRRSQGGVFDEDRVEGWQRRVRGWVRRDPRRTTMVLFGAVVGGLGLLVTGGALFFLLVAYASPSGGDAEVWTHPDAGSSSRVPGPLVPAPLPDAPSTPKKGLAEPPCLSQCVHGECESGRCVCDEPWQGTHCSQRSATVRSQMPARWRAAPPPGSAPHSLPRLPADRALAFFQGHAALPPTLQRRGHWLVVGDDFEAILENVTATRVDWTADPREGLQRLRNVTSGCVRSDAVAVDLGAGVTLEAISALADVDGCLSEGGLFLVRQPVVYYSDDPSSNSSSSHAVEPSSGVRRDPEEEGGEADSPTSKHPRPSSHELAHQFTHPSGESVPNAPNSPLAAYYSVLPTLSEWEGFLRSSWHVRYATYRRADPGVVLESMAVLQKPGEGRQDVAAAGQGPEMFHLIWTTADVPPVWRLFVPGSIFFHHPHAEVHVWVKWSREMEERFAPFAKAGYRLVLHDLVWRDVFEGVPWLAQWAETESRRSGPEASRFFYSHVTDAFRYAMLARYGGVYMDFDAILIRPLTGLRNFIGHAKPHLQPGVMGFDRGHLLMRLCVAQFAAAWRPDDWGCVGPELVTRMVERLQLFAPQAVVRVPDADPLAVPPSAGCSPDLPCDSVYTYPQRTFYPWRWKQTTGAWLWRADEFLWSRWDHIVKQSRAVHIYTSEFRNIPMLWESGSLMYRLAESNSVLFDLFKLNL